MTVGIGKANRYIEVDDVLEMLKQLTLFIPKTIGDRPIMHLRSNRERIRYEPIRVQAGFFVIYPIGSK
jgi:hypothetical protein